MLAGTPVRNVLLAARSDEESSPALPFPLPKLFREQTVIIGIADATRAGRQVAAIPAAVAATDGFGGVQRKRTLEICERAAKTPSS